MEAHWQRCVLTIWPPCPSALSLDRHPHADWAALDDVVLGCANQAGEDNRNVARMALLLAGLPDSVPGMTVNRLCGSGMEAIAVAARAIATGEIEFALAGGVESMSRAPFVMAKSEHRLRPPPADVRHHAGMATYQLTEADEWAKLQLVAGPHRGLEPKLGLIAIH